MDDRVTRLDTGLVVDDLPVYAYTLTNHAHTLTVSVLTYGATVTSIAVPNKNGVVEDVVLGYETSEQWVTQNVNNHFNCAVGRVANRVANDKFELNGKTYHVAPFPPHKHHLHGGPKGFSLRNWLAPNLGSSEFIIEKDCVSLVLEMDSPDGDMGYPGRLKGRLVYTVTDANELKADFSATSESETPVMFTTHCYYNLSGNARSTILGHELRLTADKFIAVDADLIPTGKLVDVKGTALDFQEAHEIGARIADKSFGNLYDHCFILKEDEKKGSDLRVAAVLSDATSGRRMIVTTNQLAVQLYSGNHLNGLNKHGQYSAHQGVCLETHGYINAVNEPAFPSIWLKPGDTYSHVTVFTFDTL